MKKRIYILLSIIILVVGYLFVSYRYFYFRLHNGHLAWPDNQISYQLTDSSKQNVNINKLYVALGDSLTFGVGVNNYQQSYPYLVAKNLSSQGQSIELINRSYPGYKTSDLIKNSLDQTILDKPDIITILIGINDAHGIVSASDFKKNYNLLLSRLAYETNAKIYLINIPFLGADDTLLPPYNYYFDLRTHNFDSIIKSLAKKYGASYIDLYSATNAIFKKDGPQYSKDGYHPSAIGYQIWVKVISDDISR